MTLAELKRKATQGVMALELLEWYGKTGDDIRENLRGIRKVVDANSVAIFLLNANGNRSELRIRSAKLFEYDGEHLIIYGIGERQPTAEEQAVLDQWRAIEKDYYEKYPHGDTFDKQRKFFTESACPWMYPHLGETIRGKRYLPHENMVLDHGVRGAVLNRYKVHWLQEESK